MRLKITTDMHLNMKMDYIKLLGNGRVNTMGVMNETLHGLIISWITWQWIN